MAEIGWKLLLGRLSQSDDIVTLEKLSLPATSCGKHGRAFDRALNRRPAVFGSSRARNSGCGIGRHPIMLKLNVISQLWAKHIDPRQWVTVPCLCQILEKSDCYWLAFLKAVVCVTVTCKQVITPRDVS